MAVNVQDSESARMTVQIPFFSPAAADSPVAAGRQISALLYLQLCLCLRCENCQWMLVSPRTQQKMGSQATAGVVKSLVTYGSPLVAGCQGIPVLSRPRRQETSSQVTAGFSGRLAMYGSLLMTGVRSPCWRRLCNIGDITPVAV